MHHVDFQVLSWIMSHNLWLLNYSSITVMLNWIFVKVFLLMKFPGWQCDTKFLGWHQILGWHRDTNAWIRWQNSQNDSVTANFGVKPMLELGDKTAKIWLPNLSPKLFHQHISVPKVTKWPLKNWRGFSDHVTEYSYCIWISISKVVLHPC